MFNFETNTIFLASSGFEPAYVLPPRFPLEDNTQRRLQKFAISRQLWEDWEFDDDYGSDVTCSGYGEDEIQDLFKEQLYYCFFIETFQVVMNSYEA